MQEINSTEDLLAFLREADYFHDSIIRECHLLSSGFVDAEFRMHGDAKPFDARVFIQTQSAKLPGIEIEFTEVSRFRVEQIVELRPGGIIDRGTVRFSFVEHPSDEPQVLASTMRWQFLDQAYLGRRCLYRDGA